MLGAPTTHTPTSAGLVPRSTSIPARPHTCRSGTAQSCACAIIGGNQCPRAPSCAVRMPDGSNKSGNPRSSRLFQTARNGRQAVGGQNSSDYHRSETWPDTVALPAKPAIGAPYQPFVLLLSMLRRILAALVLSHCTLHHT